MNLAYDSFKNDLLKVKEFGTLQNIQFFQFNELHNEIGKNTKYLIDGGVQFTFENGFFSIAFDAEIESFVFNICPIEQIFGDLYHESTFSEVSSYFKNQLNQEVKHIYIIEKDLEFVIDYTMKTELIPCVVAVRIEFMNGDFIEVHTVSMSIDENNSNVFQYFLSEWILLSINQSPIIS